MLEAEVAERRLAGIHHEVDRAATATVAAIGAAARHVLFTVHVDHAVAALARFYEDFCLIYKHTLIISVRNLLSPCF